MVLMDIIPEKAKVLFELNRKETQRRWRQYKRLASLDYAEEKEEVEA